MPAFDLPAMNREPGFACRSRMTDCLCRCAHEPEDRRSEKMRQVDSGDRQCSSKTAVIPAQCAPHRLACAYKLMNPGKLAIPRPCQAADHLCRAAAAA
jgi:hypothetical protein